MVRESTDHVVTGAQSEKGDLCMRAGAEVKPMRVCPSSFVSAVRPEAAGGAIHLSPRLLLGISAHPLGLS